MERPLHILSVIDDNSPFANIFDSIGNLLNSSNIITVHLLHTEQAGKKLESQLSRSKHMGKYREEGKLVLHQYDEKSSGNIFNVVDDEQDCLYWLLKPEYLVQAQAIYKWLEREEDPNAVYTLSPPAQNPKQLTRIALRLFNRARVRGMENGFIGFTSAIAPVIFTLKNVTANNFTYRVATYAALAGIEVKATDVAIAHHAQKISFSASLTNAFNNRWKWMVKEPLRILKEKSQGSIWEANHPVWRLVFFCIALLGLLVLPILSFSYGITWDEKGDADYAQLVLKYYMSFGSDKSVFTEVKDNIIFGHLLYYGPSFNLFCAFVAKYLSPFGLYETRHLLIAFTGMVGIVYAGRIGKLLGNWQTGVIVMLLLLVSPHFFGHLFNNQKDTPFAAGYIISLFYLICFLRELPKPSRKTMLFLALAFGFTIGVRIGGLLLPAYLGMGIALWWLYQTIKNGIKETSKLVLPFAGNYLAVTITAYFVGIFFWPWGMLKPFTNPIKALTQFTNYQNIFNYELFEGKLMFMAEKPWYYLPKYILIQSPLFVWAGVAFFVVLLLAQIKNKHLWFWLLLVFVSVFPVAYAIIKNSSLYNGWRQFLFIYPPLVVLAALGWQWLANITKLVPVRMAALGILTGCMAYMAFWMVKNHPNQYVYFNKLVGGTKGAYSYYETDYYSNSLKQAADWFTKNVGTDKPYVISTNNQTTTAEYYIKKKNPKAQVVWSKEHDLLAKQSDYAFVTTRTMSHYQMANGFFPPKGTVHTITVDGIPILAIVKKENNYEAFADRYFDLRQFDSTLYYGLKAVEYDDKNIEALRIVAKGYIGIDSMPAAYVYVQRSLALFPDDYNGLEIMGEVFFKQKNYDSSEKYFAQSIAHRINYSKAYINLGVTYFNKKQYAKAVDNFELAIKYSDEGKADHYTLLCKAYFAMEKFDLAIKAGNEALRINPNYAEAYNILASVYNSMGNEEQANAMYMYFLKLTGQVE
jgi:tetratricopeptide (TPR) repeat protein